MICTHTKTGKCLSCENLQLKQSIVKLDKYINQYPSRAAKIENALGITGSKLLDELLEAIK